MAKLQRSHIFPSTQAMQNAPEVRKWADKITTLLDQVFRKIASIPFNQSYSIDVADTGNANTKFTVTHHLGRVPNGFILTNSDKASVVYDDGTAWTTTSIYLKCNSANAAITITII